MVQLKEKLREAGLTVSGNKADLIKRLEEHAKAAAAEASEEKESKEAKEEVKEEAKEDSKEGVSGEAEGTTGATKEPNGESKGEEEEEDKIDYLKLLEEELDQPENDVFEIEDVTEPWRSGLRRKAEGHRHWGAPLLQFWLRGQEHLKA